MAGAYLSFCSMKQLRVLLLPPGWDVSPSQGYPQQHVAGTHLYTWVERDCGVKFLVWGNSKMAGTGRWTTDLQIWSPMRYPLHRHAPLPWSGYGFFWNYTTHTSFLRPEQWNQYPFSWWLAWVQTVHCILLEDVNFLPTSKTPQLCKH